MKRRSFFKRTFLGTAGMILVPSFSFGWEQRREEDPGNMRKVFAVPGGTYAPWVFWYWMNGHVTREGITLDLEMLKRNGFRGVFCFMHNADIPLGPVKTGSAVWLDLAEHSVREAERLGLELVLELPKYPVGDQPEVPPEFRQRLITWSETKVTASGRIRTSVAQPRNTGYYRDLKVLAVPSGSPEIGPETIVDITPFMKRKGSVDWMPPSPGPWTLTRIGYTPDEENPSIDITNREATGILLDNLSATLLPRLAGKSFKGFFTSKTAPVPGSWSKADEDYFTLREDRDYRPYLLNLTGKPAGNPEMRDRFKNDYQFYGVQQTKEVFYRTAEDWCHRRGYGWFELPWEVTGSDPENVHPSPGGPGSGVAGSFEPAAGMLNAFTQDVDSPAHLKWIADSLLMSGWNNLVVTPFAHQPYRTGLPGMAPGYPGFGAGRNCTWAEHTSGLTHYLARTQFVLQQGMAVADYCIFTGDRQDESFLENGSSFPNEYPYRYLDNGNLSVCDLKDGKITLPGGEQFHLCMIPSGIHLYPGTLKKLVELTLQGMTLVVNQKPGIMLRFSDPADEIHQLETQLYGDWDGKSGFTRTCGKGTVHMGSKIRDILAGRGIKPDIMVTSDAENTMIRYVHRTAAGKDTWLLWNSASVPAKINCSFKTGHLYPEIWSSETGEIMPAPTAAMKGGRVSLTLEIPATETVFVVFSDKPDKSPFIRIDRDGIPLWTNESFPFNGLAATGAFAGMPEELTPGASPLRFHADRNGAMKGLFLENGVYNFEVPNDDAVENRKFYIENCSRTTLDSSWSVQFPEGSGAPAGMEPEKLESLSRNGDFNIRHFSGICTYQSLFYLTESDLSGDNKVLLDLGRVRVSVHMILNHKEAGLLWKFPFLADVTPFVKTGENILALEVAIPWYNRLVGDENLPAENSYGTNGFIRQLPDWYLKGQPKPGERKTFTVWSGVRADSRLRESGLLGPVTLIFASERIL